MASTVEAGLSAGSNLVTGAGTNVATFTLPASPLYIVQSVVATVDNSAGGDATATLTYADTSGEVIAKRAQGETISAGVAGTATFALRLAAEAKRVHPSGRISLVLTGTVSADNLTVLAQLAPLAVFSSGSPSTATIAGTWTLSAGKRIVVTVSNGDTLTFSAVTARMYVQRIDVIDREVLAGAAGAMTPGNGAALSWTHTADSALLDLTAPTLPTVVAGGTYAVTVTVNVAGP